MVLNMLFYVIPLASMIVVICMAVGYNGLVKANNSVEES